MKKNPAKTVLTITLGFIIIYLLTKSNWAVYTALILGLAGAFSAWMCEKIEAAWFALAKILGLVIPRILLTMIFFLILFPLALLSRLFGKADPLHIHNSPVSLFKEKKIQANKESFEKPW